MDTWLTHLQSLAPHPAVAVVLVLAAAALVVYEPVSGRRSFARFLVAEAAEGEPARVRFYRSWVRQGCLVAALAVLLVLALPGVGLGDLGLRLPDLAGLDRFGLTDGSVTASLVSGMVVGLLAGGLVLALVLRVVARRSAARGQDAGRSPSPVGAIGPMLPRTGAGRRGWAWLSLSAGVTEEVTYRGLLLLTLAVVLPPHTHGAVLVAVAAVLFGAAHWYQGPLGMLSTGVLGAGLAWTYLGTGSLLVPMVLHTLIDLRALLLPAPATSPTAPAEAADVPATTPSLP